ncbi:MAG: hypothetical protein WD448_07195 [Woeseia sp.]
MAFSRSLMAQTPFSSIRLRTALANHQSFSLTEQKPARSHFTHNVVPLPAPHDFRGEIAELRSVLDYAVTFEDLQRFQARGAAGRRAGESRAGMEFGAVAQYLVSRRNARAGRDAAGQVLADDQDVRQHVVVLDRPHLSRSAEPGQDLIDDEQPVVSVTDLPQAGYEALRRNPVAAFGQTRFHDDRCDRVARRDALRNVVVEVPQAVVGVLLEPHVRRAAVAERVGRVDHAAGPCLEVSIQPAVEAAHEFGGESHAVVRGAEGDDVAAPLMSQGQGAPRPRRRPFRIPRS